MNVLYVLWVTISGLFPLFTVTLAGIYLTIKKNFDSSSNRKLSQSLANFFGPVVNIGFISSSFSIANFSAFIPLFIGPFIYALTGNLAGLLHVSLFKSPVEIKHTIICLISMQNFSILYIIIRGMCASYGPFADEKEYCEESYGYVSVFLFSSSLIYWTFNYHFIGVDAKHKNDQTQVVFDEVKEEIPEVSLTKKIFQSILTRNPITCLIGFGLAVIPGYKSLFFSKEGSFACIGSSLLTICNLAVAIVQLLMGSNITLMKGRGSMLKFKDIMRIIIVKNILLGIFNFVGVYLGWVFNVFGDNVIIPYVLFMCSIMPPAFVTMIFAEIYNNGLNEIVQTMF